MHCMLSLWSDDVDSIIVYLFVNNIFVNNDGHAIKSTTWKYVHTSILNVAGWSALFL